MPDLAFGRLVQDGDIVCHPWILGELVLGGLSASRTKLLRALDFLPVTTHEETLLFVRHYRPRGIGWVDVNLLLSAIHAGASVLTLDGGLLANATIHGRATSPV